MRGGLLAAMARGRVGHRPRGRDPWRRAPGAPRAPRRGWTVVMASLAAATSSPLGRWTEGRLALHRHASSSSSSAIAPGSSSAPRGCGTRERPPPWRPTTVESRRLDRVPGGAVVLVPRGWMLTSLVVLSISGGTQAGFAVAFGGILLAFHVTRAEPRRHSRSSPMSPSPPPDGALPRAARRDAQRPRRRNLAADARRAMHSSSGRTWFRRHGTATDPP